LKKSGIQALIQNKIPTATRDRQKETRRTEIKKLTKHKQQKTDQDTGQTALKIITSEIINFAAVYQTITELTTLEIITLKSTATYQAKAKQAKTEKLVNEQAEPDLIAEKQIKQENILREQTE